jgi:hypothetical protein
MDGGGEEEVEAGGFLAIVITVIAPEGRIQISGSIGIV